MQVEFDEFAWIEEQEKGVRQSIQKLQAEIKTYERQVAALRDQRVRAELSRSSGATPLRSSLR